MQVQLNKFCGKIDLNIALRISQKSNYLNCKHRPVKIVELGRKS